MLPDVEGPSQSGCESREDPGSWALGGSKHMVGFELLRRAICQYDMIYMWGAVFTQFMSVDPPRPFAADMLKFRGGR